MDHCYKDSEEKKSSLIERRWSCIQKYSSVLSVFAMMLTIAVLARNEAVIREMKMTHAELSQEIQRVKQILNQRVSHDEKASNNEGGTSGTFKIRKIKKFCQAR